MNRTDSNYRGNFTLNDQYIPRRKVINYTNCLLQQKINGESFLLKKSESDDYLFLRLTNREQKKKKKSRNIILSEHKSLFHKTHKHNVIKNQSVSKSISIEHFFRPPPPDETMSERMKTVTTNADLAIKTLLAKKHIDLISRHSKTPNHHEEIMKRLPSFVMKSMRTTESTNTKKDILSNHENETVTVKEETIANPLIRYHFYEKILDSIKHRILFVNSKNEELGEKDVIYMVRDEIERMIEDKKGLERNYSVEGYEIEPEKAFAPHSLVSNYEEVLKLKEIYKKIMKSKESSSLIENKKYINDLSMENDIKDLIHHKTNKESLMEMFLNNERTKHSVKKIVPHDKNITNNSINEEDEFFHKFSVPKKNEEKVASDLLHFLKSKPSEKELEELKKIYVRKDDSDSNRTMQHTRTTIKLRTSQNENSTESSTIHKTENDSKENVKRKRN